MSKTALCAILAILALLAGCGLLPEPEVPKVPVESRTYKVYVDCEGYGSGTASAVDLGDGIFATAAHVTEESTTCEYTVEQGLVRLPALPAGDHPGVDLALLVVERASEPVCFRQADAGESVTVVGYPGGDFKTTYGTVLNAPGPDREQGVLGADGPAILPGNSGGGAWTDEGCLAGIAVSYIPDTSIGFIVTSRALSDLL